MSTELEIIKAVAPYATPLVSAVIATYVTPGLEKIKSRLQKKQQDELTSFEKKFQKYLVNTYAKYSHIPILIFQQKQSMLKDIYVPLTLRREHQFEGFVIDEYTDDFLPKYKKVLIRDTAGMGKSTLMKRLFLSCLEKEKGIPIFIELRKLQGDNSIITFILKELHSEDSEFDQEIIFRLLDEGNFVFFLDGYDEINISERDSVAQSLHSFISRNNRNLFIMTSRPEGSLASFPQFMEFGIQPLKLSESFELIRRYDKFYQIADKLIDELENGNHQNDLGFLTNPLLVSLFYKSYDYKQIIQPKKHLFYRQVYDALYENHDQTKEGFFVRKKFSGLDSDDFHAVLRALGYITIKYGIEYDKDQILLHLNDAKKKCPDLDFKVSKFLEDLLQTVPLFTKEGNYYRWSHKSLQDYFTALYIQLDRPNKSNALRKMIRSKAWYRYSNVLELYHSIDFKTFKRTIVKDYVCEFLKHYKAPIVINFDAMFEQSGIDHYKSFTFYQTYLLIPKRDLNTQKEDTFTTETLIKTYIESENCDLANYFLEKKSSSDGRYLFCNYNWPVSRLLFEKNIDVFVDVPARSNFKAFSDFCLFSNSQISVRESNNYFSSLLTYILLNGQFVENTIARIRIPSYQKCLKMNQEIENEILADRQEDLHEDL